MKHACQTMEQSVHGTCGRSSLRYLRKKLIDIDGGCICFECIADLQKRFIVGLPCDLGNHNWKRCNDVVRCWGRGDHGRLGEAVPRACSICSDNTRRELTQEQATVIIGYGWCGCWLAGLSLV